MSPDIVKHIDQDWIEEREAASLPKCHPWKLNCSIREAIADGELLSE